MPQGRGPGRGRGPQMAGKKGKPKDMKKTLGRLMSYVGREKKKVALAFVCVILTTIANLAASYVLRPVINSLGDSYKLWRAAAEADKAGKGEKEISGIWERSKGPTVKFGMTAFSREGAMLV